MGNLKNLTKKNRLFVGFAALFVLAFIATAATLGYYTAFYKGQAEKTKGYLSDEYLAGLKNSRSFENTVDTALPQTAIYQVMYDHMTTPRTDGKTPKLLFIGYDGMLATGIDYSLLHIEDSTVAYLTGLEKDASGKNLGGAWLAYCGGANYGDQSAATAAGWTSELTGKWAIEHGVYDNYKTLNSGEHTLMYTLAKKGLKTSFSATWNSFFSVTWLPDVNASKTEGLPIVWNNAITGKEDEKTRGVVIDRIKAGDDAIFCTLEYTDHSGHGGIYSIAAKDYTDAIRNNEADGRAIIDAALGSTTAANEDWLIILTTDHGGYMNDHGYYGTYNEKYIFFVSNKRIF